MSIKQAFSPSPKTLSVLSDYSSHIGGGFAPYPVAITRARNAQAWDVDGKEYIDFLSGYSVVNMGHSHPKIVAAAVEQLQQAAVVNLPWHSPLYGQLGNKLYKMFGYEKFIALTSGAEAVDAAVKIARKWGYLTKKIPEGEAFVLTAAACYHGMSISTASLRSERNSVYGPFVPSVGPTSPSGILVKFGSIEDLRAALEKDGDNIAAFLIEPIQASAGVIVPPAGYLKEVETLCKKHNVLFIADEVQAGLGRCGADLCHLREEVRPDLVVLGKALAGGMYPLSGVMGDAHIIDLVASFEIGTTMAANPPACAAALAALDVLSSENLSQRAVTLGELLVSTLQAAELPLVVDFQGAGLLWGIVLKEGAPVERIVELAIQRGLLVRVMRGRVRLCPPLTIKREDLLEGLEILIGAFRDVDAAVHSPL